MNIGGLRNPTGKTAEKARCGGVCFDHISLHFEVESNKKLTPPDLLVSVFASWGNKEKSKLLIKITHVLTHIKRQFC